MSSVLEIIVSLAAPAVLAGLAGTLATFLSRLVRRIFKRDEERERARLRAEVLGPDDPASDTFIEVLTRYFSAEALKEETDTSEGENPREAGKPAEGGEPGESSKSDEGNPRKDVIAEAISASRGHPAKDRHAKFALLLVDYYAYGLTQARTSFAVSLTCSMLGGLVLIAGVALAIFTATNNGHIYAGIVTSVSGVLTTSIGVLFHRQANRALQHMEEQTNKLRQDMKAEQDASVAIDLLDDVSDEELKGRLQAALILRFSGAKLPEIGEPRLVTSAGSGPNGARHTPKHTESSTEFSTD